MPVVTLIVAGLHGVLLLVLASAVVRLRRGRRVGMGDGGDRELARRIRVHANFVEYVPTALLLLALLELGGLNRYAVGALGVALLIGRLLHAQGLGRTGGTSFGRMWGTLLTWGVLGTASVAAIALGVNALLR